MLPVGELKRKHRDDTAKSPLAEGKRQKIQSSNTDACERVGATELASAFALASLASMSPPSKKDPPRESEPREADQVDENSTVSWEDRSPKNEPAPITPEVRSPIRSQLAKRVSFAPNIKEANRIGPRRYSFPPRMNHVQVSRMPPGFARAVVPPPIQMVPSPRPSMPVPWRHQQRMIRPPAKFLPQQPMSNPRSDQWVCDYCNVAAFPTFQEACAHEESCRARLSAEPRFESPWNGRAGFVANLNPPYAAHGMLPTPMAFPVTPPGTSTMSGDFTDNDSTRWFEGSCSLAIPETDPDWLSGLNCYIRRHCVEAFSATSEESSKTSKRGRIAEFQVGIRCCFCRHRPSESKEAAAVSFPISLSGIYESVKRWQRVHLELCNDVPSDVRAKLNELNTDNSWIPTTRQYWTDSAKAIGMIDTPDGIRFAREPSYRTPEHGLLTTVDSTADVDDAPHRGGDSATELAHLSGGIREGEFIVFPEDTTVVPPYVYFLMRQVESCRFTEADRFVARSKGPVGYPGFQCRHCNGHAGLGKYFPVSSKSLATNSTSQNIHAHLLKCRKCPAHIKEQLLSLKDEKSKAPRLEPGWRKVFFDKIWARLHG